MDLATLEAARKVTMADHFATTSAQSGLTYLALRSLLGPVGATPLGAPGMAGTAYDYSHAAAPKFPQPGAGFAAHLLEVRMDAVSGLVEQGLILLDRLVSTGGASLTAVGAQAVNSVPLPARAAGGEGVELWIETWVTGTATATTFLTISYTNQDGVAGRVATTQTLTASAVRGAGLVRVGLQAGDTGVRTVESVSVDGAVGSVAGSFGVTLARRIGMVPSGPPFTLHSRGVLALGLPALHPDTFLAFATAGASLTSSSRPDLFVEATFAVLPTP